MERTVSLRFTGEAKSFIEELQDAGLTEQDIFGKALYILERAWRTERVAMLKELATLDDKNVDFVFKVKSERSK